MRILCVVAISFYFTSVFAQQPPAIAERGGKVESQTNAREGAHPEETGEGNTSAHDLLYQSYLLGGQLWPEDHAFQMVNLLHAATKMRHPMTKQWLQEFMNLSQQLPITENSLARQKSALIALAGIDSEEALKLLAQLPAPYEGMPGHEPFGEDVRADATYTIFPRYWKESKNPDLSALRSVAQYLGNTGQYPFRGVSLILSDVHVKDPAGSEMLFLEAAGYYAKEQAAAVSHKDFLELLKAGRGVVPDYAETLGVTVSAEHLLKLTEKAASNDTYYTRVSAGDGNLEFHSLWDELLYQLLPLVREFTPSLEKKILQQRPASNPVPIRGESSYPEGYTESVVIVGKGDPARVSELVENSLERDRLANVLRLADSNPELATKLANEIVDPTRHATALAAIAGGLQESDPVKASELEEQLSATLKKVDERHQLRIFLQLARSGSKSDRSGLWDTLHRGLDIAEQVFEQDMRLLPGRPAYAATGFEEASELMQIAAASQLPNALGWLAGQHSPLLKADLLISAATGVWNSSSPKLMP